MSQILDPVWVPLADGDRLAARVWLPDDADHRPCPVILEAIPYRRTDGTLTIDHPRYAWWAQRGFGGVRVDIRGSGDSDGLLTDEYLAQEQDDDLRVIQWIAAQRWCNGRVGMIGYSWGGFAGLQVASRRPAALAAVVTVNSTVRRYTDDCHYIGGAVNAHDMLSWATTMLAFDARPPDPAVVGERWRDMWARRLDVSPPMIERWLAHQLEDQYWRHGSVAFDYDAVQCPVLAVGGWSDPYRNAVLDLLEHLSAPCFGLIGPWAHGYPHATLPGPRIGFLTECARFFGRYLRDDRNDYEREPPLRVYLQSFDPPAPFYAERSGRWVSVDAWPPPESQRHSLAFELTDRSLRGDDAGHHGATGCSGTDQIGSSQTHGLAAGHWCPYGGPTHPSDQRSDDARSLCFDSSPLDQALEILGFPRLRLRVAADRPRAILTVRLCDVSPTGESLLVTRGILNLTHRHGHGTAVAITPGELMDVALRLDCAAHRFAPGHRLRLAIAPTYWPWVWPAPEAAILSVPSGSGRLELPRLTGHESIEMDGPEALPVVDTEWVVQSPFSQLLTRDVTSGAVELRSQPDFLAGRRRIPELGLETEDWGENVYRIVEHDPLSAEVRCHRRAALARPGWDVRVEADAVMCCTREEFIVDTELRAFDGGRLFATRSFHSRLARRD